MGRVALRRGERTLRTLEITEAVELTDVQIGSMFVTAEVAKTTLAPAGRGRPGLTVDGRHVESAWDLADVAVPLPLLSRWQRLKLLWAPTLRPLARLRLDRHGEGVRFRARRRWRP